MRWTLTFHSLKQLSSDVRHLNSRHRIATARAGDSYGYDVVRSGMALAL